VTISDTTAGATIYYTTNGTTPTTSSTKYTGAITVSATETVKAIAVATNYSNSAMATATYTIGAATTLPAPTFSPAAGTYSTTQTVTISDATAGTTIYYTTNGTTPTTSSTKYTGAITVSSTETITAIAVETGYTNSPAATATFTISAATTLPAPTFSPAAGTYSTTQTVTISDATAGTTIYYTTNGTTPTTSSTKYTGAITVSATETITAIAVETGYTNSPAATATFTISAATTLPAPTFSPAAGTYATAQTVTISDATAGTTIYYTTNGTTPTTSSTKYTGTITVSATETIKAIAVETGYTNSAVATAAYTISSALAAPTFSPAAGTYTSAQSVTISDATAGTTIYYTTDGTTPTASSTRYTGAIWQSSTQTLKAVAVETGYANSPVTTATYTIAPVLPAPTFSPQGGGASWALFTTPPSVTISDATAGTTIYYTINGTTPTTSSTKYTGPITVNVTETIAAIAVGTNYTNSPVSTMLYSIAAVLPTPTFSLAAGTYSTSQTVTISDATAGATIYYTTNGATPTTSSTKYTGAITVSATETIKAIAVATNYSNSAVATAAYTISAVLPSPTFSPAAGTYSTSQTVTISDATAGTTIYYTTNGTTPTTSSTKYTGAITVSATETVKAIAIATGYTNSAVATAAYTISVGLPAPTFSPAAATYTSAQSVTISDATTGAAIYYTTDGSTPTASSTRYTGAIWQSATQTLKAIAVQTGYANSSVTTATYTIAPVLPAPTFSPQGGGPSWALFTTPPSVTISDATAGTTIYYTTNGSTPTTSSTKYTGPITVNVTETIAAIAVGTNYTNSPVSTMLYSIAAVLPTPTFSPAAGTYSTSQKVTISDATAGTTIYYTTNGTTPTTSSTKYTGAITVSATETIKAIAVATNYSNSAVATAAYTISGSAVTSAVSDFTISASSTAAATAPGGSAAFAITITPLSPATTLSTPVNLLVSGLPAGATYSLSPATVAEGAGVTAVALSVQVPQTVSDKRSPDGIGGNLNSRMAPLALGLLLLPFAGRLRNAAKQLRGSSSTPLLIAAAILVTTGLGGCGATNNVMGPTQQAKTYIVTVIGTSSTTSTSTTVTLTVES
jgi:hypothetical protein